MGRNFISTGEEMLGGPSPSKEELKTRSIEDRVLIENFLDRMRAHMTDRELEAFNRFISRPE